VTTGDVEAVGGRADAGAVVVAGAAVGAGAATAGMVVATATAGGRLLMNE
jgi:hypothetical protein